MSKEIVIKTRILEFPIYMTIDTLKSSKIYTSLCTVRNKLIENNIVSKDLRYRMHFYKKIDGNLMKIKEGDILEGIIILNIEDEIDYSEPVNILFYLEKRITEFEDKFKDLYNSENYIELKNIWSIFREENSDCFDYAEWYVVMRPISGINLLEKMAVDIRKWFIQKERVIIDIDLMLLNKIVYEEKESDYDVVNKFLI